MKFISLLSLLHALQERNWWGFCAAMATDVPMPAGPNLRLLRDAPSGIAATEAGFRHG
ncbi:MAG: hypothetical protein ACM3PU_03965 [Gemmatimonadota bacterium]